MELNMKCCLSEHLVYTLLSQREAAHLHQQQWNIQRREKENTSNSSIKEEEEEDATLLTQEKTTIPSSLLPNPKNVSNIALTKKDRKVSIQQRKSILLRSPSNNSIEWVEVEDDYLTQKLNHAQSRISKSNNTSSDDGIGSQNALFSNT
eukprot:2341998-Ditylum_brightwellii.AAC.1